MGVKALRRLAELLATRLRESSQDVIELTTALSVALAADAKRNANTRALSAV
jgi:hypothetical protein